MRDTSELLNILCTRVKDPQIDTKGRDAVVQYPTSYLERILSECFNGNFICVEERVGLFYTLCKILWRSIKPATSWYSGYLLFWWLIFI